MGPKYPIQNWQSVHSVPHLLLLNCFFPFLCKHVFFLLIRSQYITFSLMSVIYLDFGQVFVLCAAPLPPGRRFTVRRCEGQSYCSVPHSGVIFATPVRVYPLLLLITVTLSHNPAIVRMAWGKIMNSGAMVHSILLASPLQIQLFTRRLLAFPV